MATNASSFRGATQWDPVLILSQIVCLQSVWYCSISAIVYTLFTLTGTEISLDVILDYREIRFDNSAGLLLGLAWVLNGCVGVYLLLRIVARARLVLDFSLTLLLYHVVMTTLYSDHLPTSFLWWGLNATTAGIMIFGGEYVCMQHEMEPIVLGGGGSSSSSHTNNNSTSQDARSGPPGAGTGTRSTGHHHARTRSNGGVGVGSSSTATATTANTALGFIQSQTKTGGRATGRYDAGTTLGDVEESTGLLMMDSLDHLHHDLANSPATPAAGPVSSVLASPQPPSSSSQAISMMTLPQKAK